MEDFVFKEYTIEMGWETWRNNCNERLREWYKMGTDNKNHETLALSANTHSNGHACVPVKRKKHGVD